MLNDDFNAKQSVNVESLPEYVLSGGNSPFNSLENDCSIEVFLNAQSIYFKGVGVSDAQPPISFQAKTGDVLRIVSSRGHSEDALNVKLVSPLWLFTPSGKGIKLHHGGENNYTDGVFIDLQYVLP
ncbi:hypothetical protein MD588_08435 [Photobacterium sp. SDRW27]|uniref:hypothetical protein n=1 Tax=Photobacterium obscurum TaxID=2829490 RepID=UPI002243A218|nr:hypothetical protein [Photobacterium obscurum]MCW8328835.1 hypothetical protein [Photobacterium obscurum]